MTRPADRTDLLVDRRAEHPGPPSSGQPCPDATRPPPSVLSRRLCAALSKGGRILRDTAIRAFKRARVFREGQSVRAKPFPGMDEAARSEARRSGVPDAAPALAERAGADWFARVATALIRAGLAGIEPLDLLEDADGALS